VECTGETNAVDAWFEGDTVMAGKGKKDKGSKDKGDKTQRKKAQHTLLEKRKLKKQKNQPGSITTG
jgi:hypothetical protein